MSYILLTWLLAPIWLPVAFVRRMIRPMPRRIVIFEIAGIGDVVCSTHLFAQLRARYPEALIDLVVDPIAASMAPALSMINRVIQFPYARQRGLVGRLRLVLCCLNYDTAICLIPSAAQLTAFCLAALPRRLSVMPAPLNNSYFSLRPLLNRVTMHEPGAYFIKTQADLFQYLDVKQVSANKSLLWQEYSLSGQRQPRVGILVGSGRALKRMSTEQLVLLSHGLLANAANINVVLMGGPADQTVASEILSRINIDNRTRVEDLTGRYALSELPAAIKDLAVLIGVDSGVMHMADALEVPLVCIAGPVDLKEVYAPGHQRILLESDLPCHPCSRVFDTPAECHLGHRKCLQDLDISRVLVDVANLLEVTRG